MNFSREFIDLPNGKKITVWKKIGNKCIITDGRYYGLFEPNNFLKTSNINYLTLFYSDKLKNKILVYGDDCEVFNNDKESLHFVLYNKEKFRKYIYNENSIKFSDVKDGVILYNIDISSLSLTNKSGEKIN
jgi:hypothetical protein